MDYISPSDLKTIMHSKRVHLFQLEHCKIIVREGRVEYITQKKKKLEYWNIPIANTTVILLGSGTSITQAASRELSKAGVLFGFCGGEGSPLFSCSEYDIPILWMTPQNEYRPTEYLQKFTQIFFDDEKRLVTAKYFQKERAKITASLWIKSLFCKNQIEDVCEQYISDIDKTLSIQNILLTEGRFVKKFYSMAAENIGISFTRDKKDKVEDGINLKLSHGNYLAYGHAAVCLWVLGIPHGLSILHGKTRRGALVFDVADIIKEAVVLRIAFSSFKEGLSMKEFRSLYFEEVRKHKILDHLFTIVKNV